MRAGTTSRLPRGGLKGPAGQGSLFAVLSQGHACGGAGGEGGRRSGVESRIPGWEDGSVRTFGIRLSTQSLILSHKVKKLNINI